MCWYQAGKVLGSCGMTEDSLSLLDQRNQRQHQEGETEVAIGNRILSQSAVLAGGRAKTKLGEHVKS